MKKLIFIFLIFATSSLHAEWKYISTNKDSGEKFYIDTKTLKKIDGYIYFWNLIELPKAVEISETDSIKSMQSYNQVDCKFPKSMVVTRYIFDGSMGNGKLIKTPMPDYKLNTWEYPPPESSFSHMLTYVCDLIIN
jgi:hypothetical protein